MQRITKEAPITLNIARTFSNFLFDLYVQKDIIIKTNNINIKKYRGRPRFSVFGVGDYAFAPWKVATSGFHKRLSFAVVGPAGRRPVVLDDTCYFITCEDEREALALHAPLESEPVREFYSAFVFWDSKRPITVDLLRRLDLGAAAREAGRTVPRAQG